MESCKEGLYKGWRMRIKKEYWLSVQLRSQPLVTSPDTKVTMWRKNILHPICYPFVSWLHISAQQFIILEQRIESQRVLREHMGLHPCFARRLGATGGQGPGLTWVLAQTQPCMSTVQGLNNSTMWIYWITYVKKYSTKNYVSVFWSEKKWRFQSRWPRRSFLVLTIHERPAS